MKSLTFLGILLFYYSAVFGHAARLDEMVINGHQTQFIGDSLTASEGVIGRDEIENRPILRSGEVLEFVPGMVVTQHSGSGKANQYFLRGFNLDHGTDFRTLIDGMPINMRTHGHGQGYTDLNFIIPELIDRINFQKGAYHTETGDFSTAGSAEFFLANRLERNFAQTEIGEYGFYRNIAAGSFELGGSELLLGFESHLYNGPWEDIEEDVNKFNGIARWNTSFNKGNLSLMLMAYDNQWNSADQIPQRAIEQGIISELGSLDTTVGGESSRYSISGSWNYSGWKVNAYAIQSNLDLYSNFTYFLDDPVNGDQFEQVDQRMIYGGDISHYLSHHFSGLDLQHYYGIQFQYDDIQDIGLYRTLDLQRLSTVREDSVNEYSIGLFWETEIPVTKKLIANLGTRYDYLAANVNSNLAANSGNADDDLVSFTAGLRYMISNNWETYLNAGQSYHSNDARGSTITVDPETGAAAAPVDLLVRGTGAEIGLRYFDAERLNLSLAIWYLELDSELLFVGDAGNTEASRASERYGVEFSAYYWFKKNFSADLEVSVTESMFTENEVGEGNDITGALPFVLSTGFTYLPFQSVSTTLRLRHFGKRVLNSSDSAPSQSFSVVNWGIDYKPGNWQLGLDVLNLFDSNDRDIEYFYESQLSGEDIPIEDVHFHVTEPRQIRLQLRYSF